MIDLIEEFLCFRCSKEGNVISKCANRKHIADGVAARVQHMQSNRRTAHPKAAKLVLYEMWQRLAESESDESGNKVSETFFTEEREVLFNSGKSQGVKNQPSDIINPPRFPILKMILHYSTKKSNKIYKGELRLDLS